MFDETVYRNMTERISPDPALVARVKGQAARRAEKKAARFGGKALRKAAVAAAFALCLGFALPALAVNSPDIYRLMYAVSPAVAQFFKPVQESCESDGIRMEVVSKYVHKDTAEFYVAMQDLTGERVDASIDLYDSYDLGIPFDNTGTCSQVDFDAKTNTATFLIQISTMDGSDIPGGKATFSITCFLSGKQVAENLPLELDWSKLASNPQWRYLNRPHGGNTWRNPVTGEETTDPVVDKVLVPGASIRTFFDGFTVTAMGYLDGKLHLQLDTPGRITYDDHAFLELVNERGDVVYGDMVYHDFIDSDTGHFADYIDYVFAVPEDALGDYTLRGSFYAAKNRTDGLWQVTFPIR